MWQVNIRPYRPEDFDAVHRIDRIGHEFPWAESTMRECLGTDHFCWVLEIEANIEAFIIIYVVAQESEIWNFCVAPPMRRRGYARLLLNHALDFAKAQGAQTMYLEVRVSNRVAQALYQHMGFQPLSVRKAYYRAANGSREDALVLARSLT